MDPLETAKADVKALVPEPAPAVATDPLPVAPPSTLDAKRRQAARVREATISRWLRRLSG